MARNEESNERFWEKIHGQNKGYVEEQFDMYKTDPNAVDPSFKEIFDAYGAPDWLYEEDNVSTETRAAESTDINIKKLTSAMKLVEAIRRFGHLEADIYPVGIDVERDSALVHPEEYGLSDDDLREIPAHYLWDQAPSNIENGLDVINELKKYYTGTIAFEHDHVNNESERQWLMNRIETGKARLSLSEEERTQLLKRLAHVEGFEGFLQKTFVGQKRFSIEGLEAMVPMLDHVVKYAAEDNVDNIMMGMAHRGRLSVLAHVLGKPYDIIFSEFSHSPDKELMPSEGSMGINYGWTGDVKYHLGATRENAEATTKITLANNPSHLEFINPVVEGFARAAQDDRTESGYPEQELNKALSVLIHGDAAIIGEGIAAETFNLSGLDGYSTGGSLHIIANNLIGYTTTQDEGRSTRYASDLAKGFEVPIVHVNADDPVACVSVVKMAYQYCKTFHKDFLIDLVGFRRYGHNEMDEPRMTQPLLYSDVDSHKGVAQLFAEDLEEKGIIEEGTLKEYENEAESELRDIYESMQEHDTTDMPGADMPQALTNGLDRFDTAVSLDALERLNQDLLKRPEGFEAFKRLEKIMQRRENVLEDGNKVDWGAGEALTYASILKDGIPIRLTGQDTERGTFAHRHAVLHDVNTGEKYCIFHGLRDAKASFDVRNSPLSEAGAVGFEYGYSVHSPETLVLWEAQFGDFANAAQVIFDQFMSASRAKWNEKSNMILLLPHGYEGQGPEHSSARLERFLQLSAENNLIVANVTSSAQFFHLIRRQAAMRGRDEARPLVLMTPKSLLRNERVASPAEDFTDGKFTPIRTQPNLTSTKDKATRLMIGSGKVMVDIEEAMENSEESFEWLHVVRLEQIYPFPEKAIADVLESLPNVEEIVWLQEEPKNMGAWDFVESYLRNIKKKDQTIRYVGRSERSSPAVGDPNVHKVEQNEIIEKAINPSKGGVSSERN